MGKKKKKEDNIEHGANYIGAYEKKEEKTRFKNNVNDLKELMSSK